MRFANNTQLIGALPMHKGSTLINHWVVLVDQGPDFHSRYVTAVVGTLDDGHWDMGHYFTTIAAAEADLYLRANIHAIDRDSLVEATGGRHTYY
jgi:hypothetical protein